MLSEGPLNLLWGLQGPTSNKHPLKGPHLEKALGGYLILLNQNQKKDFWGSYWREYGAMVLLGERAYGAMGYGGGTGVWGYGVMGIVTSDFLRITL